MLPNLIIGAEVYYVVGPNDFPGSKSAGEIRPAVVTNTLPQLERDDGSANLQVFADGRNDDVALGLVWLTERRYSATKEQGTWHWRTDPPTPWDGLPPNAPAEAAA